MTDEGVIVQGVVANPNAPIKLVGSKTLQQTRKFLGADWKSPNQPDDERLLGGQIEHPLVVLNPGTGIHDNAARYGSGHWQGTVVLRKHRSIKQFAVAGRPGNTLRAT